jgi:hypothetical protein
MMRAAVAGIALAALSVVPAAHASDPDVIHGGCSFDAAETTPDNVNAGVMSDFSVTTTGDTPPLPIGATVTCWIAVNGVAAPGTTHSYGDVDGIAGVQAGMDPVTFVAGPDDFVAQCQSVTFADGTTWMASPGGCPADASPQVPPQVVPDTIDAAASVVSGAVCDDVTLCAALCPVLQRLAGDYGPIAIEPDGDVDTVHPLGLGTNPVIDCPA